MGAGGLTHLRLLPDLDQNLLCLVCKYIQAKYSQKLRGFMVYLWVSHHRLAIVEKDLTDLRRKYQLGGRQSKNRSNSQGPPLQQHRTTATNNNQSLLTGPKSTLLQVC